MRTLAATGLVLLASASITHADEKPKFTIELSAPKEIYPDEVPSVKAAIRNNTREDATVLRDVDGAFDLLRGTVDFRWVVKRNGQLLPRRTDVKRIDNHVNTIGVQDLVKVPAGKSADLGIGFGNISTYYKFTEPGKYTIELRYEFDPAAGDKVSPAARDALRKLKGVAAEGKVEVAVVAFPAELTAAEGKLKVAQARHQIAQQVAEAVGTNPNATADERAAAAARVERAAAVLKGTQGEYDAKLEQFRKKREEQRKKDK